MKNTHIKQIGGARIGISYWKSWKATFPFATLRADSEQIVLKGPGIRHVFPRETIVRLSRWRRLPSVGLRIEHTQSGYEPFIVFWTFNYRKLKRVLQELEYPIVDNKRNIKD